MRPWYNHPPEQGLPMLGRIVRRTAVGPLALLVALLTLAACLVSVAPAQAATTGHTPSSPTIATYDYIGMPDGSVKKVGAAQSKTASVEAATCQPEENGDCYWFNDGQYRFFDRDICVQNNVGVYWNYTTAEAGFQSGDLTVRFYNHGPSTGTPTSCASSPGWTSDQILQYNTYGTNDGGCYRFGYGVDSFGFYTSAYVSMNVSTSRPAACGNTLQHRNNNISRAFGRAIGLAAFSSSTTLTAAVMNVYFANSYNYPGTDDRNALYYLYQVAN